MNSKVVAAIGAALVVGLAAGYYFNADSQESFTRFGGGMMNRGTNIDSDDDALRGMGRMNRGEANRGNCLADDCLYVDDLEYPVGELTADVKSALDKAIADEYNARATYEAVIENFGQTRPFSMIIRSEEQHISMLKAIYDKYGLTPPADTSDVSLSGISTLPDACQAGVDAEIANADLYKDELLRAVSGYDDITGVFTNLMNASQDKHLPAFERCN